MRSFTAVLMLVGLLGLVSSETASAAQAEPPGASVNAWPCLATLPDVGCVGPGDVTPSGVVGVPQVLDFLRQP
jgi:hypothetical protein